MIILPGPDIAGDVLVTPVSVRRCCRSVSGVKVPVLGRFQQSFAEIAHPAEACAAICFKQHLHRRTTSSSNIVNYYIIIFIILLY